MSLVGFDNVVKAYAGVTILDGVSFEIAPACKVGLVGENGSGKSTILRLMTRAVEPDSGRVAVSRSARIAYVPQEVGLRSDRTAYEEALAARPALWAKRAQLLRLEGGLPEAPRPNEALAAAYADAVADYSAAGGYRFEREAEDVLRGVGFSDLQMALPLESLSGGEAARVALARAILAEPTLLLLDEPDNHLDIEGIQWLEQWLKRHRGALVLVTHDRRLLEEVVDSVMEVQDGKVTFEKGSLAEFMNRKQDRIDRQMSDYLEQQRRVRKLRAAINRAAGKARGIEHRTIHFHYRKQASKIARRAVTLRRRLERELDDGSRTRKPRDQRDRIRLDVAPRRWHARTVLRIEGVAKAFGGTPLFDGVDLELSRGERLALVGPNGSGKTTLMEIAIGLQPADAGDVWLSGAATVFYCDQHLAGLEPELSVYDTVARETDLGHGEVHYLLAKLLFRGNAVHKQVRDLSGGERTRLLLALLMNTGADLLMLDEPTNHLDLPSIAILQEGLSSFAGAVLFISHDRAFIGAVATDVYELRDGELSKRR